VFSLWSVSVQLMIYECPIDALSTFNQLSEVNAQQQYSII